MPPALRPLPLLLALCAVLAGAPGAAARQAPPPATALEEVDPPEPPQSLDGEGEDEAEAEAPPPPRPAPRAQQPGRTAKPTAAPPPPAAAAAAQAEGPARSVPRILAPRRTNADLLAAWDRWQQARAGRDAPGAAAALAALQTLQQEVGAEDLGPLALGLLRAGAEQARAGDAEGARALGSAATGLAPHVPAVRFGAAALAARVAPLGVGGWGSEVLAGAAATWRDPGARRAALTDVGAALLLGVLATAFAAVALLFVRRARYALHDFRHLLPRGTARWQVLALGALLVSVPAVLRLGWVPVLLALLAAVALHLALAERAVAAGLLVLASLVPFAGGALAGSAAFAGSVAEDVHLLERGGLEAEAAAGRTRARFEARAAGFPELFALGRFEARRGDLKAALVHLGAARALQPGEPRVLTNLGNVLLALGEEAEAERSYRAAAAAAPGLAAPRYNLSHVHRRRARGLPNSEVGQELGRGTAELQDAQRLDPALLLRADPPEERQLMNALLLAPGLTRDEVDAAFADDPRRAATAAAVRAQLTGVLCGGGGGALAPALTAALALALLALGGAGARGRVSGACGKCGRPVCRRCDPELPPGSVSCGQCVFAFNRRGAVSAQVRARKTLEVERHQALAGRRVWALGALLSGAGHLSAGAPVRGALWAFAFLTLAAGVLVRHGVLRAPGAGLPAALKLVPLGLALAAVYVLSLRALSRLQRG